jgi:L-threonylcarbamoyladenylate synthase
MAVLTARVLPSTVGGVRIAAAIVRAGGLVAFPTETVYGLGADALSAAAVRSIFAAKGRPADDPLIVHLAETAWLARVAVANSLAERLAARFWPGPLTLVLPKLPIVPSETTAGLDTVAVRVPAHSVALGILRVADVPIAAPSANLFGRPSPTRAAHVLEDLGERIDAVVDGGPTRVGVESTIVDLSSEQPRLLRPGGLPAEEIEAVLGLALQAAPAASRPLAPGMLPSHYAPRTPLVVVRDVARLREETQRALANGQRVGALLFEDDEAPDGIAVARLGRYADPATSAARLFGALRELDRVGCDVLFARLPADPNTGLGLALADRLRRAANSVIET